MNEGKDGIPYQDADPADEIAGMKFHGMTNMLRSMGLSEDEINHQKSVFIEALIREGFLEFDRDGNLCNTKKANALEGRLMGIEISVDEDGEYFDSEILSDAEIFKTLEQTRKN